MKLVRLLFLVTLPVIAGAQPAGTFHSKKESFYTSAGSNVFISGFASKGYKVACVNTAANTVTEKELGTPKGKVINMNSVVGGNTFYTVAEVSDKSGSATFSDVKITSWSGQGEAKEYSFPGRWNGNLRYALATDDDIYFLIDRQVTGYTEEYLYRSRFALIHVNMISGVLNELPLGLSMVQDGMQCSFWCPLRIGPGFTEWYRTKLINKFFAYEIVRLDASGKVVKTTIYNPLYSCRVPDFIPEFSRVASNIFINRDALVHTDSSHNSTMSLLTMAPLHFVPELNNYFSVAYVSEFKDKYTRGFSFFQLSDSLTLLHWGTFSDIIQGGYDPNPPKDFSTVSVEAALGDSSSYFEIYYKKLSGKIIERRAYAITNGKTARVSDLPELSTLGCYYLPGIAAEQKCRKSITVPAENALYVFTRSHAVYFLPGQKESNIYIVATTK